jgi:hypothetical protein
MKYALFTLFSLVLLVTLPAVASAADEIVSVYVEPASIELKPGQEFIVKIGVNPRDKGISSGEVNVSFNPDLFELVDATPGDLLGPSPLTVKKVDNGFLRYAVARVGPTSSPTPQGVLAEIRFKVKTMSSTGMYIIELLGIALADEKFNTIADISIDNRLVKVEIAESTTPTHETAQVTTIFIVTTHISTIYIQRDLSIIPILAVVASLTIIGGALAIIVSHMRRRRKPLVLRSG